MQVDLDSSRSMKRRRKRQFKPFLPAGGSSIAPPPTSCGISTISPLVDGQRTEPTPKKKWVTVPIRRGKKIQHRPKGHSTRAPVNSSFYAGLDEWPDECITDQSTQPTIPSEGGTVDLSSGTEEEASTRRTIKA